MSIHTALHGQNLVLMHACLVTAASKGRSPVVEFLIGLSDLDIFARNLQNETAYDIAAERRDIKIYQQIEAQERRLWTKKNPSSNPLLLTCVDLSLPAAYSHNSVHNVVPYEVVEHARVDLRTRRPQPTLLIPRLDPPHFVPTEKELIPLPSSTDPSLQWGWISKWSIRRHPDLPCDADGWRFAQRWDSPPADWIPDALYLAPISRAGLVSQRVWIRVMKRYPREQHIIDHADISETDDVETHVSLVSDGALAPVAVPDTSAGSKQAKSGSMSSKLLGLVAGTSTGK